MQQTRSNVQYFAFVALSWLGCSDGSHNENDAGMAEVITDASAATANSASDGSAANASPIPSTPSGDGSLLVGNTGDSGANMSAATDAGTGTGAVSLRGDGGDETASMSVELTRGPGARMGSDFAPRVACADLRLRYLDDAPSKGLLPMAPPFDRAGTCGPETAYEPNDVPAQACKVPLARTIASEFGSSTDKNDYYQLAVEKDVVYTFDYKFDSTSGRVITMSVGGQIMTLLAGQTYYNGGVLHDEFTPQLSGPVVLNMTGSKYEFALYPSTAAGLVHDALTYEPNNTRSTAAPICVGVPVTSGFTSPMDNVDFYELSLVKDQTYTLKIKHPGSISRDITALVSGQILTYLGGASDYNSGREAVEFIAQATGPAALRISGGDYELVVLPATQNGLTHDSVTFEPNDTPSTYYPMSIGTTVVSEISSADDISDYFGFEAEEGVTYLLSYTSPNGFGHAVTMPRGKDTLTLVASSSTYNGGSGKDMFTAPASGLLLVASWGGKSTFSLSKL